MVLIAIGVVLRAIGVHHSRAHRTPAGAEPLPGRVVDVEVKRSSQSNDNTLLYGATMSYRPAHRLGAGAVTGLLPAAGLEVGDEVTLMRDPATGVVKLPLPNPRMQMALPFAMCVGTIVLGVMDLRE